jgi:hypothetical protein
MLAVLEPAGPPPMTSTSQESWYVFMVGFFVIEAGE